MLELETQINRAPSLLFVLARAECCQNNFFPTNLVSNRLEQRVIARLTQFCSTISKDEEN